MNRLQQIKENLKESDNYMLNVSRSDVEWLIQQIEQPLKDRLQAFHQGYRQGWNARISNEEELSVGSEDIE